MPTLRTYWKSRYVTEVDPLEIEVMGRRILEMYDEMERRGENRI